ncbi:conserved hypothetical protein (plasmid) [Borreliella garinii PBr]|uniref:Uncharacterized protein n=1 Tax=Borreliella garinii PBr TaxID=498743 RepID=B8F181_BORGR|nr:conserved hypothetical protein [Borreliella garinii PBr]
MIENEEKENLQVQAKEESQIQSDDTKVISYGEYEEYMCLKKQANNVKPKETTRDLSINERITKELAEVEERER